MLQVDVTRVRSISSSEDAATVMVPHYAQSQHRIEYAVRAAEGSVNDSSSETSAGARNDSFCSGVDGEAAISIASKKKYPADDLLTHSSRKNQSDKQQQQQQASSYGGVDCERQRLVTGVKIIWVAGSHRRRGIARKLLDAARRSLTFGHIIPKQQMVFSQPTADGFAFAKSYCGGRGVMAYA